MRLLLSLTRLIKSLRSKETNKLELAEELQFHLDLAMDKNRADGMTDREALLAARASFGSRNGVTEESYKARGTAWIEDFKQDCHFGLRTLLKYPGFSVITVLTLALGIGACTAIFSIVEAVLLRSQPYGHPQQLVYLFTPSAQLLQMGVPPDVFPPSFADYFDLKKQNLSFSGMTLFQQTTVNLAEGEHADKVGVARVDADFFNTLQVHPALGRAFNGSDETQVGGNVVIISHELWQNMFAGRIDILGKKVKLDGENNQLIGVMPSGFDFPSKSDLPTGFGNVEHTQIWVPSALTIKQKACRDACGAFALARLKSGKSLEEGQAELDTLMPAINSLHDPAMHDYVAYLKPLREMSVGPVRALMQLLLGAVGLVLLIACSNAANLLLARGANRTHELGVRAALGALRGRLLRQLLTESLLLGIAAGLVGSALAWLFLHSILLLNPGDIPRLRNAHLNLSVLSFLTDVTLVTSLLFGVLPSLAASRIKITQSLKIGGVRGIGGERRSMQRALAVSQIAFVVILLMGAGLLLRSYAKVLAVPIGLSPSTVTASIQFSPQLNGLKMNPRYDSPEKRMQFLSDALDSLQHTPGIQNVGWIDILPLSRSESMASLEVKGYPQQQYPWVECRRASAGYFAATQIYLKRGRVFTDDSGVRNPDQVVVNEALATLFFGKNEAIGQQVRISPQSAWLTIVGVIGNVRNTRPETMAAPQIYTSIWQSDSANTPVFGADLVVRSVLPAMSVVPAVRREILNLDPNLAVGDIHTLGGLILEASAQRRFQAVLLTVFAVVAMLLALIGVYGLLAYMVRQRTGEIGIRMALGSTRKGAAGLILKEGMIVMIAGSLIGIIASLEFTRTLASFLFEVPRIDAVTYALVPCLLSLGALAACLVPGLRASKIDPTEALRSE